MRIGRLLAVLGTALALVGAACASENNTIASIDGIEMARDRFEMMHPNVDDLVAEERASTLLLMMIHDLFIANAASQLGIELDEEAAADAFAARTPAASVVGSLEAVLANRGVTPDRVQLEADLDALSGPVGRELVRREAPGFDLEAAYESFLLDQAYVCVRQILLAQTADIDVIVERLDAGEAFDTLAREFSRDPLAQRPEGESGGGGDMGCSYPNAFGLGISEASLDLDIAVGEPFGPVFSDTGFHLMMVYEREIPDLDAVRAEVVAAAEETQGPTLFTAWAVELLKQAEVTIDAAWGSWGPRDGTNGIPTVIPTGE